MGLLKVPIKRIVIPHCSMGLLKVPVKRIVILTVWHLGRYGFTQAGEVGEELAVFRCA